MDIAHVSGATTSELRQALRMSYVMQHFGHQPEAVESDGKLHYRSPFRDDENPSFDIFMHQIRGRSEPEERYGDFADPNLGQGDVIDLIRLFTGCSPAEAFARARNLLVQQIEDNYNGPTVQATTYKVIDIEEISRRSAAGEPVASSQHWSYHLYRSHPGLVGVVPPVDRVFHEPASDVIVFLLLDGDGKVQGARERYPDGRKKAVYGSKNIMLRTSSSKEASGAPVIITEGETDTWAAWGALGDKYEVRGIMGANTPPSKAGADDLAGREVFVCFDPDEAGIKAREIWATYLRDLGCEVRIIVLPDGRDVSDLQPSQIRRLPDGARSYQEAPEGFVRAGNAFADVKVVRDEVVVTKQSNFDFTPTALMRGDDGITTYRGYLSNYHLPVTLPVTALRTRMSLNDWGMPYNAVFNGSDAQVSKLTQLLAHDAAFLPEGKIHNQVGLYEGTFVWPEGSIGKDEVSFTPAQTGLAPDRSRIFLKDNPVNPVEVFEALYNSQDPAVTGPILAWLAAAPLRTRFGQKGFPTLSISGVSGSGKSSLTRDFLAVFSSTHIAETITSSTPYGVEALVDVSCGFPVWFDEYRPGSRDDAKSRLDQLIRDGYNMSISSKGSGVGQKMRQIRTAAPLVVSGEDSFTETSHTDRMILVRLNRSEQGDMSWVKTLDWSGFGHSYLKFLTEEVRDEYDSTPPVHAEPVLSHGDLPLSSRQAYNVQVLHYGWGLLTAHLSASNPYFEMPPLDVTRVISEGQEAGMSNPVLDLVHVCLDNETREPTAWRFIDGDGIDCVAVHPQNLIDEAKYHPSIVLPVSNAKGIMKLLQDNYNCGPKSVVRVPGGKPIRALRIPADRLGLDAETKEDHETDFPF